MVIGHWKKVTSTDFDPYQDNISDIRTPEIRIFGGNRSSVLHGTDAPPFQPSGAEYPRSNCAGGVCGVGHRFRVKHFLKGFADIEQFLGEFYMDKGDVKAARKYLEDSIEHCTHCWRYWEGEPDFDYVLKEEDFYYVEKEEEWWYRPRWEKAVELMKKVEGVN